MDKKTPPRQVPSRDEKYMGLAFWYASFSKDPVTQMGAVIINDDNWPLGHGYNGMPSQYNDDLEDWGRPSKYDNIIHAERNAIDRCLDPILLKYATIYVTGMPCKACMLRIVEAKLREVIYFSGNYFDANSSCNIVDPSIDIARKGRVILKKFVGNLNWMRDRIQWMESVGIFN